MSDQIRPLTPQNAQHAIDLMNQSSRDTSVKYALDIFAFRWLARYWNISYDDSMIYYVDDQPAAVILNSVDLSARDAYTVYWGAHPWFRKGKIALSLVEASSRHLYDRGCLFHYADSLPERPARRYRFVNFHPACELVDMQAESPVVPALDTHVEIRSVQPVDLPEFITTPGEFQHWSQRHSFLRNSSSFLRIIGAFASGAIQAYAVKPNLATSTTLTDLRSPGFSVDAGYALLSTMLLEDYQPPLLVRYIFPNSYTFRLLSSVGFTVTRRYSVLVRDLSASFIDPAASRHTA